MTKAKILYQLNHCEYVPMPFQYDAGVCVDYRTLDGKLSNRHKIQNFIDRGLPKGPSSALLTIMPSITRSGNIEIFYYDQVMRFTLAAIKFIYPVSLSLLDGEIGVRGAHYLPLNQEDHSPPQSSSSARQHYAPCTPAHHINVTCFLALISLHYGKSRIIIQLFQNFERQTLCVENFYQSKHQ